MVGIYCIENIYNSKKYIGQSVDVNYRLKKHFTKLRNQYHENKYLQRSFDKYGENNFKTYILEECPKDELNEKEKYWIKKMDTFKNGYNLTIGGDGVNGWKGDEEFKRHMSEIVSGEKNPNYGHYWTDEMKQHLSDMRKGKYENSNNPNSKKIICVEKLKIYDTINDASEDCGCKTPSSISRCLKNKSYVANNYHFVIYSKDIYDYLKENKFEYLCECYKGKGIIADTTNHKFYTKYQLEQVIYNLSDLTTRKVKEFIRQDKFEFNNTKYVSL